MSPSLAQPRGRRPPRVAIAGSTPWAAASSCRNRGSNRGFSRLHWSAQPTLLVSIPGAAPSSSRYRGVNPADKIPYRGVNPAHKIPPRVVIVVPTPPRVAIDGSNKGGNRGVRYNHVSQPRGVRYNPELQPLVSELLSCWGGSACNHWVKTNPSCNCTLPPTGCIVLGCMRLVRATS